jgi:hypothetical protein
MALVLADRVRETTTTTGTGTISLGGPVSGFEGFSTAIGNANTTYYAIADAATGAWEVGLGTYTSSGSTLARTTVLSSSNAGAAVNFAAGTKDVFVTQPAERALYLAGAGTGINAGAAAFTANGVVYASSTSALATGSALVFDGTNLGIGVSPTQTLNVKGIALFEGTAQGNVIIQKTGTNGVSLFSDTAGTLGFYDQNGAATRMILTSSGLEIKQSQLIGYSSYTGIGTNGLAVAGNVGVGTASPTSGFKFDVQAARALSRTQSTTGTNDVFQRYINTGGNFTIGIDDSAGTNQTGSAYASYLWSTVNSPLILATNNTAVATFSAAGNLGLGVTPSAWGSGFKVLNMAYATVASENSQRGQAIFVSNAYNSGTANSPTWVYTNSARSLQYRQDLVDGTHAWFTAPSGTAGNAISFTQAMTLDASGNLLVGQTSPAYNAAGRGLIEVNGASTALVGLSVNNVAAGYLYNSGSAVYLGAPAGQPILFDINGERGRFSSDGTFRVKGAGTAGSTDAFQVAGTAPADAARIDSSGNLLVGTTSALLSSSGRGNFTLNGSSDAIVAFGNNGSSSAYIYSSSAKLEFDAAGARWIQWNTNGNERARIDSSGNLLIGSATNTTVSNLILNGATRWAVGTQSGGNLFYIVRDSDNVGQYMVNGSTSWTATSDERLKDIIEPITDAANKVLTLRAVIGKFKKDTEGTRRSFLIAQDVQAVLPEAVTVQEDKSGTLGIQYTEVIPLLVAAIQEQQTLITALTARITALESSTLQ